MKTALVTGATGFIGQALVVGLIERGVRVTALVHSRNGLAQRPGLTIVEGTLPCGPELAEVVQGGPYDVLYHLAWQGVSTTKKNNPAIQISNIQLCVSAMWLARETCCKRVVFTGSISEYAYADGPVSGSEPPSPCDLYAAAKASAHLFCSVLSQQQGTPINWLLVPSVYGPGRTDNNLISYAIRTLLAGEKPSFTKLEQKWNYLYIDDLVESLYLTGEKGKPGRTYATGGEEYPLREYVEILRNQINPALPLGIGEYPYKLGNIDNSEVDIAKFHADTGYVPQVSFEQGIKKTISFFADLNNT